MMHDIQPVVSHGLIVAETSGAKIVNSNSGGVGLKWDFSQTFLDNARLTGDPVKLAAAKVNAGWVGEYHVPSSVVALELQEEPVVNNEADRKKLVFGSMNLAAESLAMFAAHIKGFGMVGGLAYPMEGLLHSGITPQQLIEDGDALKFLSYFMRETVVALSGVDGSTFRAGVSKNDVVRLYQEAGCMLDGTWKMDNLSRSWGKISSRITYPRVTQSEK